MIFSFFDPIDYKAKTVDKNAKTIQMTDIFRNYKAYFKRVASGYRLRTYYIQGSPRPEELAYQIYGNTQLYWVLLFCNENYDPYYGWITSQESAYRAADQRYEKVGGNQVLYHVDDRGEKYFNLIEDPNNPGTWYDKGDLEMKYPQYNGALAAVDTYEASVLDNEQKRVIKIISPTDIDSFLSDLIREMEIA
ncbi:baseplate wedge subunit [Citrobacter phage Moon]|uniref:Baseplate wedge subunit n=1 Tax=Citrobacter phage Moon TaxID=1540095 RepID=A0A0A0YTL7_9CAUD|nr:baseplate wedge subunit [Citrobacter phage Moon]AIX12138.1 baseplate wedge subunit [Citrobacter phage Moon]